MSSFNPYDRTPGPKGCKGKDKDGDPCERQTLKGGFCKKCSPIYKRRRAGKAITK